MADAFVGNAADREQVKEGARLERDELKQFLFDLAKVAETREGRRVIWRMLEHCRVFESIMETSAKIYYNSGRQDVGHWLLKMVENARPTTALQMAQEDLKEKQDATRSRRKVRNSHSDDGPEGLEDAGNAEA